MDAVERAARKAIARPTIVTDQHTGGDASPARALQASLAGRLLQVDGEAGAVSGKVLAAAIAGAIAGTWLFGYLLYASL